MQTETVTTPSGVPNHKARFAMNRFLGDPRPNPKFGYVPQPNPDYHAPILFDGEQFTNERGDVIPKKDVPAYILDAVKGVSSTARRAADVRVETSLEQAMKASTLPDRPAPAPKRGRGRPRKVVA